MARTPLIAVLAWSAALTAIVLASVDWSPTAIQDPARTLGVDAQGVIRLGQLADRPPFSPLELAMFIGVGLAFIASGMIARQSLPSGRQGILLVTAGLLWTAGGLRRSSDPAVFTIGLMLTLMYQPPLLQLLLSFPSGKLQNRALRLFVAFFYSTWLFLGAATWIFLDPSRHTATGVSTSRNLLLLRDDLNLTLVIGESARALQVCVGAGIIIILIHRWRVGTKAYRRAFLPLWVAGLVKTVTVILLAENIAQATVPFTPFTLLLQYPVTALIPMAVLIGLWQYRFARGHLADFLVEIGEARVDGSLVRALRRAVRDPSLTLWTWSSIRDSYLDEKGSPQRLPGHGTGRAALVLERGGTLFGALVFDETLSQQPHLLAAVRGAASLAMDNQRLEQQLRAQLAEVQLSRERIVAAGDERRRQLERDLHDGAQQRLVAAAISLARAQRATNADRMNELIQAGSDDLRMALRELRELARGVYPTVLRDKGLVGALSSYVERAPLPVEIKTDLQDPPPGSVQLAAYFIAAEAVTNAIKHANATHVRIRLESNETSLMLEITDNGSGGADIGQVGGLVGIADRASALGGSLTVHSPHGRGTSILATLPYSSDNRHRR